jgi:DNA/RNA-binding domain of Phe-tRNA-synthetase-like protein
VFVYDPSVTAAYPTIRAGILNATGLVNGPASPTLAAEFRLAQIEAAHRLGQTDIADIPSIASWRRAFTRFGAKPTQHRSAVEALLRRLSKQGDISTISALVDIGNLVSIRYAMPVAVIDASTIDTQITVRFATGSESFTELGSEAAVHPEPGEVMFIDAGDQVSARRWCWRQSAASATNAATTEALFVIEGHHDQASVEIDSALAELGDLLARHQPQSHSETWKVPDTDLQDEGMEFVPGLR